jgi:hypothetical protein
MRKGINLMAKYDALRKRIEQMAREVKGGIAPYMATIKEIKGGYELNIAFWDGKEGSGNIMPPNMIYQFSLYGMLEDFLLSYLKDNKPKGKFVIFSGEEDLLD